MAKLGVFKKTVALVAAIALVMCFAVSVSAAPTINTTTQYIGGGETDVHVKVGITDLGEAEYVTYYATSPSNPEDIVYLDQKEVENGSATFDYQTEATNLGGDIKVGYTGATEENPTTPGGITSNSVSVQGKPSTIAVKIPTEATEATITLDYASETNKTVASVTADNATVTAYDYDKATEKLTVSLSSIDGDVVLTVTEKEYIGGTPEADLLDAAAIVVKEGFKSDKEVVNEEKVANAGANADKAGDRKLTVIAKVTNADTFGIIVSTTEITATGVMTKKQFNDAFSESVIYASKGKNEDGAFAVQLIDTSVSSAESMVITGQPYYTAVYAANSDGTYHVDVKGDTITAVAPIQ